jgi:predicted metalloprotease with PDZ domain
MDDFARAFFGIRPGDWGVVPYTLDDVVRTLNRVYPYDWRSFLDQRVNRTGDRAPLGGFTRSGYRLDYADTPNPAQAAALKTSKANDLSFSAGLTIDKDNKITQVIWGGPAFRAGLVVGETILAVDGRSYSEATIKERITAAKGGSAPLQLTTKRGDEVRLVPLSWNGGLRYPRFTKVGRGRGALDILLEPK